MKFSKLTKISFLLAGLFFIDKILAFARVFLTLGQFGLSKDYDVFNAANNIPDMLFMVISGGALAIAFIPVLSEVLHRDGQKTSWVLFSRIANLAFLFTTVVALIIAIFADTIVRSKIGIAPGFSADQQDLVIKLMRMNLIATLIFSISGLVMAGLQTNQHFLLPALAPIFYNLGQIFGVTILAPTEGITIGPITLPALGLGVEGLVYGVIIGAVLHLVIQIPGLIKYNFRWIPSLGLKNEDVHKVIRLMGPRVLTIGFIQLIFIVRDNLASRLGPGSVSSLSIGWMIQQVPETIIGTAIATALLPTLAEHFSSEQKEAFAQTIQKAVKVVLALTLPVAAVLSIGLKPLLGLIPSLDYKDILLVSFVTAGFLLGLLGHSLKEIGVRSFYARKNALIPLITAGGNLILYAITGSLLYRPLGAAGIALTDSLVFSLEAVVLLILLNRKLIPPIKLDSTWVRALLAAITAGLITWGGLSLLTPQGGFNLENASKVHMLIAGMVPMIIGFVCALPWIRRELALLLKL